MEYVILIVQLVCTLILTNKTMLLSIAALLIPVFTTLKTQLAQFVCHHFYCTMVNVSESAQLEHSDQSCLVDLALLAVPNVLI